MLQPIESWQSQACSATTLSLPEWPGQNSAIKMLPADDQQREFAAEVQQRLPSEARVSFYRTETEQGGKRYGVILSVRISLQHTELSSAPGVL